MKTNLYYSFLIACFIINASCKAQLKKHNNKNNPIINETYIKGRKLSFKYPIIEILQNSNTKVAFFDWKLYRYDKDQRKWERVNPKKYTDQPMFGGGAFSFQSKITYLKLANNKKLNLRFLHEGIYMLQLKSTIKDLDNGLKRKVKKYTFRIR